MKRDFTLVENVQREGFITAITHTSLEGFSSARQGGWYCGYIGVPPGHPWYSQDYDSMDVQVHGGLTYASKADGYPCSAGDVWWLGFDCAHAMDHDRDGRPLRDLDYVQRELDCLAMQAAKAAKVLDA